MLFAKLDAYQQEAVEFVLARTGAGLFAEQGTGKTWITGGVIERLCGDDFTALLIVSLANINTTWVDLIERELPQVTLCRSWAEFKQAKGARVLLVHYEALREIIKYVSKRHWTLVVYDESQRLKGRGTGQSRLAKRFRDVDHRLALSGTPIEQSPEDLWGQFRFIAPECLGTVWADFAEEYMRRAGYMGYEWQFRRDRMKQFLERIDPYTLRIVKRDVLSLPGLTYVRAPVDLLGSQGALYRQLDQEMTADVGDRTVTADLEVTLLMRLHQICGGFVRTDVTAQDIEEQQDRARVRGAIKRVGNAKLRKLKSIVARESTPVVIFCRYVEELNLIREALSPAYRVEVIKGERKGNRAARDSVVRAFQRGDIDVLICQIKAGGVGLDLWRSHVAVFYSTTWSYIDFDQAVCRLHRRGQIHAVRVYLIYAKDTVDEQIYSALLSKQSISAAVLNNFRRKTMSKITKSNAKPEKSSKQSKPAETKATKSNANADASSDKAKEAPPAEKAKEFKYGVQDLADALEIKPASVRVALRNHKVEKAGKSYGWNNKQELQEVINLLKSNKGKGKGDEATAA
jgi:SNF2 family DNA or RNA helicase